MEESNTDKNLSGGRWLMANWRGVSAFVYLVICIFDFVVYPSYIGLFRIKQTEFIIELLKLDPEVQKEFIKLTYSQFTPYTLQGSGLFHLSFGAILTGAAITKFKENEY